jgi:lactoylglutathione lyase
MKFGYAILYVDNVGVTLAAWQTAFGLALGFEHEDGIYGELETGETTISFAETEFGRGHFKDASTRAMFDGSPSRFEIGLVTQDVHAAFARATAAGMTAINAPQEKPWGQLVAWVRDANGILIELASPMESA